MSPSSQKTLNILIIGGGIAGLSAAIPLARQGHRVEVFESHTGLAEIGGCIAIAPNGIRVLDSWGLKDNIAQFAQQGIAASFRRYDNDETIANVRVGQKNLSGYVGHDLRRASLQKMLYDAAIASGAEVHFSKSVSDIDVASATVSFADGEKRTGDLIVGADGVRSVVRRAIYSNEEVSQPRATQECYYLVDLSPEKLRANPDLAEYISVPRFTGWLGPNHHMIVSTVGGSDIPTHVYLYAPGTGSIGQWNETIDLSTVKAKFKDFGPIAKGIVDAAGSDCFKWKIAQVGPLPRWSDESGRVVLLGDAAHAMYPALGQGATQTLEDAASLALCISAATSGPKPLSFQTALGVYESVRKPRASRIQEGAEQNCKALCLPDGPEQQTRDERLREGSQRQKTMGDAGPPPADMNAPVQSGPFNMWIIMHDTTEETRKALEEAQAAA